jgi:DNA-binding MarR family transcriptional regulator
MSTALDLARDGASGEADTFRGEYQQALRLIERLHRLLLDVIKDEFDRNGGADLNSVQALLLYNIGDGELTAGELKTRGYYLGSNVSYNVRKMVENDYLIQERSTHDRRSVRVRLSEKGITLHELLDNMFAAQAEKLGTDITTPQDLDNANALLRRLERFWIAAMNFPVRASF